MTVKVRKVGTSMVLTVPSQIKPQSKEYTVCVAEDGVIFTFQLTVTKKKSTD